MPGHWLGLVINVLSSASILMVGRQEEHLTRKNPIQVIHRDSLAEWLEKNPRQNWLTHDHLQKRLLIKAVVVH